MNKLVTAATTATLLAGAAFAQDVQVQAGQGFQTANQTVKLMGAVKGSTVKGAPYSGEEVVETTQVLADGTRIHQENKTTVYRDSEGRTRRENPNSITISDPVANVTYVLSTKNMTGSKLAMAGGTFTMARTNTVTSSSGPTSFTFTTTTGDNPSETRIFVNGGQIDAASADEVKIRTQAKISAEASATSVAMLSEKTRKMAAVNPGEPLGKQMIEGVQAEGTRHILTIQAGEIGNDRPIQVTNESWYSPDLKLTVMTKRSDPRTGEEAFHLTNINRTEPAPYLFQVPAGYQINERK